MADLVIVVDMQRGFLEEGNPLYCGDEARCIIPHVQMAKRGRIPGETHNPRLKKADLTPYTKP